MKQKGSGHVRKHAGNHGAKHKQAGRKHNPQVQHQVTASSQMGPSQVHASAKMTSHPKPRQLSPGCDIACCSAQAVATLAGWDWQQVLDLYWRTARDPDAGATIADTLAAAALSYLPGVILGVTLPEPHAVAVTPDGTWWSWGEPFNPGDWPDLVIEEAWAVTL